jgi:hypothetical protein
MRKEQEMKDEVTPEAMERLVNVLRDEGRDTGSRKTPAKAENQPDLQTKKPPARA